MGPFGCGPDRFGNAVHQRWEGRRIVEVGHRDVGVAGHHEGTIRFELTDRVDDPHRVGAVEDEVAADHHGIRPFLFERGPNRLKREEVTVDVAEDRDPGHQRSTEASGMMKLSVAWQATWPSTVAVPRPRPKRLPSLSMVTSRRSVSPGLTTRLKRHSSIPPNRPIRSPKPGCLATKMAIVWASASTWSTPGMTGSPGKWPWKNHSVALTALIPTIHRAPSSYSMIRSTRRNGQRCGISPSISRVVWTMAGAAS